MNNITSGKYYEEEDIAGETFMIACPTKPAEPKLKKFPEAPNKWDWKYQPEFTFLSRMFKALREKAIKEAERAYQNDYKKWEEEYNNTILRNDLMRMEYKRDLHVFRNNVAVWNMNKAESIKKQK